MYIYKSLHLVVGCFARDITAIRSFFPNRYITRHVTLVYLEALRDEPNKAVAKRLHINSIFKNLLHFLSL